MEEEIITLLSTPALDKILDEKNERTKTQVGGPSHYISKVFEKLSIPYQKIDHPVLEVEILVNDQGEFGKINTPPSSIKLDFANIKTPYLLISTILEDFDLENIYQYKGFVFLDVQGYVRNGADFGKKKTWFPSKKIQDKIDCLVGTTEELSFLPKDFVEEQKNKVLIETKGAGGVVLYFKGNVFVINPSSKIHDIQNSIGAGDTFLANFSAFYIQNENVLESTKLAMKKTEEFLQSKELLNQDNQSQQK